MSVLGKYRNGLGVEISITGQVPGKLAGTQVIGALYEGYRQDDLFGRMWIFATLDGLADCGYKKIQEES